MHIMAHVSPNPGHQRNAAFALQVGLAKHGHRLTFSENEPNPYDADAFVTWGWRNGAKLSVYGKPVMVMERAYVADRFTWTSFGWNGLNGNARFHIEPDGGDRWRKHFDGLLKEPKKTGDKIIIMGQVKGDASLNGGPDMDKWYMYVHDAYVRMYPQYKVLFRDHPSSKGHMWARTIPRHSGSLESALSEARMVIAFNSNSLVDARLAGIDIISGSPGSMAWQVSARPTKKIESPKLEEWAHAMAWTQWLLPEVESGDAIPFLLKGLHAPVFSSRQF